MREDISQGDILKVENIKMPVLAVSKDFFNQTGEIVGCPIDKNGESGALHIKIETDRISGCVKCEQLKLLDMNTRGYSKMGRISMSEIINIADAIQSIFDYI